MKAELLHLLDRLRTEHPDFHHLIISHTGAVLAVTRFGTVEGLNTLASLETFAWPQKDSSPSPAPQSGRGHGEGSAQQEPITSGYSQVQEPIQPLTNA